MIEPVMASGAGPPPIRRVTRSSGPRRTPATAASAQAAERMPASQAVGTRSSATNSQAGALPAVSESDAKLGVEHGLGAFVTPPPMKLNQVETLKFVVAPNEAALRDESNQATLEPTKAIYVGKAMRVTLRPNPSFEIAPTTEAMQLTLANKSATWVWNVKPLNTHNRKLEAYIEVFALNDDDSIGKKLDDYPRDVTIQVEVDQAQRLGETVDKWTLFADKLSKFFGSWQKAVGSLVALLGALGLLAWKLGLRKAKPAE